MHATERLVVLGLLPLLYAASAFSQAGGGAIKEGNLYSVALFSSLAEMEKSWGYIDDGEHGSRIRTDYRNMIVVKDPAITDDLPSQFGEYRVEYLDNQAVIERCQKLGKEFSVLKIGPMHNEGPLLKIVVSVDYVTYKKKRLMFGISDWAEVELRYDCEKQNYIVSTVKLGGI